MPYKRGYKRKRSSRKKSAYSMAKMALKKANRIESRQEKKHTDLNIGGTDVDWDGTEATLNLIAQGTEDTDRIGDKCTMTSCRIHLRLLLNGRADACFRIILMYDKQDQYSSIIDFLQVVGTSAVVTSAYNVDLRNQFIILYDKRFILNDGDRRQRLVNIDRKLNKLVKFNAGTTDLESGALKLFVMSANADTAPAEYEGYCRVWFADS